MKKLIAIILCLVFVFGFAACNSGDNGEDTTALDTTEKTDSQTTTGAPVEEIDPGSIPVEVETVVDREEADAYQTIVVEGKSEKYVGETVSKEGIFTYIYDEFSGVTRYYVWGYNDSKMVDCWQWELKVDDPSNLPKNGSLVTATGVIETSEDALDKVWLSKPSITVKSEYSGETYDVDMSVMSPTLARVQIASVFTAKDKFEGKTIAVYGKVVSESLVGHPTNPESWQIHIHSKGKTPDTGKLVVATGVLKDGVIDNAKFTVK